MNRSNQLGDNAAGDVRVRGATFRSIVGVWFVVATMTGGGCRPSSTATTAESPAASTEVMTETTTPKEPADKPNIVLVIVCTFRYDRLSAAGYLQKTTPFLDSLADGGSFLENAVSASSWTQPSVTSILTSLTPNVHRMRNRARADKRYQKIAVLPDEIVTLPECLAEVGYATFGRINNIQAGDAYNIPQGFDDIVTGSLFDFDTRQMVSEFSDWLEARGSNGPFFALLLTADAHYPFDPRYEYYRRMNRPSETVAEEAYVQYRKDISKQIHRVHSGEVLRQYRNLYAGELAQLDDALSRLAAILREAGHGADTLFVVTGDHGERFYERGKWFHGGAPDEAVIHVPLIMAGPGIPAGGRHKEVVRTIDIYPTLAALAGGTVPDPVQGTSLVPLIQGRGDDWAPLTAFASYTSPKLTLHAVRRGRYKLYSDSRLYDLTHHPAEVRNLITDMPDVAHRLQADLSWWLEQEEELRARVPIEEVTRQLKPKTIERLRTLGYIDD